MWALMGIKLYEGGVLWLNAIFSRVVKVGAIKMEERELCMKGHKRWIIYHILPFVCIYDYLIVCLFELILIERSCKLLIQKLW